MGGWEKIKCNPPVLSSLLLWLGRRSKEPSTLLLSTPPLPPYSFHFTQQFIFTSNFHTKRSHTAGASYSLTLWLNMQGPAGISALYSYRRSTLKLFLMSVTRSSWTIIKILFYLIDLKKGLNSTEWTDRSTEDGGPFRLGSCRSTAERYRSKWSYLCPFRWKSNTLYKFYFLQSGLNVL